jgi:PAS domain S-box-containing protein
VTERTARLVGSDGSAVVRFEEDGTGCLLSHWERRGLLEGDVPVEVLLTGGSPVALVYQTGSPAQVDNDPAFDDLRGRFVAGVYPIGFAVPIRDGERLWGALTVGVRRPNVLCTGIQAIMESLAKVISVNLTTVDPLLRLSDPMVLDALSGAVSVGIAVLNRDLHFLRVNTTFAVASNRSVDEHLNVCVVDEPLAFPQVDVAVLGRVLETGVAQTCIVSGRVADDPDGVRYWRLSCNPVTATRGTSGGVVVLVTDVTREHRAVAALGNERSSMAALVAAMHDGVVTCSPDAALSDVSTHFCEMTGFARDELIGTRPPYPFWGTGEDAARNAEVFDRVRRGSHVECELTFVRRDGRQLPVHVRHSPMVDGAGAISGYIATVRDITDRHRAEEERAHLFAAERAARNRTEILQQVSAALSKALTPEHVIQTIISTAGPLVGAIGGSVLLDEDGSLVPAVRQDRRMRLVFAPHRLSVSPESPFVAVPRDGTPIFLSDRAAIVLADWDFEAALRPDVRSLCVVQIAQHGKGLGALAFGFPEERSFDTEDRALLVTIGDVCAQAFDRARLYDAARARADAFRQRDALRRAVLRGVSHEFRSPLTAISNAADALARVEDVSLRTELLDVIGSETRRLDRFVANVLDLSRLEGGALEPRLDSCSAAEVVAGALDAVHALVGDVAITVDVPDDIPLVRIDPVLTERILLNLIHNAARHGGPNIGLSVRAVEGSIWFVVADDGPGVPSGLRRTIFEPFVGQRERGGLGVGLGLSRGLARAQGGELWLDDGRSGGTRFVVSLPPDPVEVS